MYEIEKEFPGSRINRITSYSEFFDNEGHDIFIDVQEHITELKETIPDHVLEQLLALIKENESDIIEKCYIDKISNFYDKHHQY